MSRFDRLGAGVLLGVLLSIGLLTAALLIFTTLHGFVLIGSGYMITLAVASTCLAIWTHRGMPTSLTIIIKLACGTALFTVIACSWATVYEAAGVNLGIFSVLNISLGATSCLMLYAWASTTHERMKVQKAG